MTNGRISKIEFMFEKETPNILINQIRTYVFICTDVDRTSEQSGKFLNIYLYTVIYPVYILQVSTILLVGI